MNPLPRETISARCLLCATTLLMCFGVIDVHAGDPFDPLDSYVKQAMTLWGAPGVAIAIVKDGETVLARYYGVCEIGTERKVDAQTAFPIASCAKSITAAALALLVDEKKLRWNDRIAAHLPDFELADAYVSEHVTVRDLLCHRTGLRRADLLQDGTGISRREVLSRLKHLDFEAEFRTRLIYNNHAYTVLDELVSRLSGRPCEEFVDQRLFQPLAMKATVFDARRLPPDRLARRHWRTDAGIVAREPSLTDGIHSTASDMARWLEFHLAEGTFADQEWIRAESIHQMHALHFSQPVRFRPKVNVYAAQFYGAGLGWFVQDYRGHKLVLHSGSWGAMLCMIPEKKLGVVVLSNLDLESLPGMLMYDLLDVYLVGPAHAFDTAKWKATWLRNEPPGDAYRPRDAARAELEKARNANIEPSRSLDRYAGQYVSPLYGSLSVSYRDNRLFVEFGEHITPLMHWERDAFYARSPTRLTFDWLLKFQFADDDSVAKLVVAHVGWDGAEKDHVFVRASNVSTLKK